MHHGTFELKKELSLLYSKCQTDKALTYSAIYSPTVMVYVDYYKDEMICV